MKSLGYRLRMENESSVTAILALGQIWYIWNVVRLLFAWI